MTDHSGFKALTKIDMDSKAIETLPAPSADNDAVRKIYVDDLLAALLTPWDDTGLVLHLPFSGNEGQIAKDASFYKNDGAFKGAGEPAWCEGRRGPAVEFDGADDYILVPDSDSLDLTDKGTIELWIYSNGAQANYAGLIQKGDSSGWAAGKYFISHWTGGTYYGVIRNAGAYNTPASFPTVSNNAWHHLVLTWDGSWLIPYTDGVAGTPKAQSLNADADTKDLQIGKSSSGVFDGKMDEIRIYNRALSADEVKMHYLRSYSAGIRQYTSRAKAYLTTANQDIPDDTVTKIELNAVSYDKNSEFDIITDHRFITNKAGYYLVIGQITWLPNDTPNYAVTKIYKNGSRILDSYNTRPANSLYTSVNVSDVVYLDVGDYLELWGYQDNGAGNVEVVVKDANRTFLTIHKISD